MLIPPQNVAGVSRCDPLPVMWLIWVVWQVEGVGACTLINGSPTRPTPVMGGGLTDPEPTSLMSPTMPILLALMAPLPVFNNAAGSLELTMILQAAETFAAPFTVSAPEPLGSMTYMQDDPLP